MSLYGSLEISRQGLSVQRKRMQVIAANMANISTTQTPEGGAYRRRQLVVESVPTSEFQNRLEGLVQATDQDDQIHGARATEIRLDPSPLIQRFEPNHPHADENGYVAYPNVNPAIEMVDMMNTARSYESNVSAVRSAREMFRSALDMLRT